MGMNLSVLKRSPREKRVWGFACDSLQKIESKLASTRSQSNLGKLPKHKFLSIFEEEEQVFERFSENSDQIDVLELTLGLSLLAKDGFIPKCKFVFNLFAQSMFHQLSFQELELMVLASVRFAFRLFDISDDPIRCDVVSFLNESFSERRTISLSKFLLFVFESIEVAQFCVEIEIDAPDMKTLSSNIKFFQGNQKRLPGNEKEAPLPADWTQNSCRKMQLLDSAFESCNQFRWSWHQQQHPPQESIPQNRFDFRIDWVFGFNHKNAFKPVAVQCSPSLETLENEKNEFVIYFVETVVVVYYHAEERQRHYTGHTGKVCGLAISKSGRLCASGEEGLCPSIHVWEIESLAKRHHLKFLPRVAPCLISFYNEDNSIFGCTEEAKSAVMLYDLARETVSMSTHLPFQAIGLSRLQMLQGTFDQEAVPASRTSGIDLTSCLVVYSQKKATVFWRRDGQSAFSILELDDDVFRLGEDDFVADCLFLFAQRKHSSLLIYGGKKDFDARLVFVCKNGHVLVLHQIFDDPGKSCFCERVKFDRRLSHIVALQDSLCLLVADHKSLILFNIETHESVSWIDLDTLSLNLKSTRVAQICTFSRWKLLIVTVEGDMIHLCASPESRWSLKKRQPALWCRRLSNVETFPETITLACLAEAPNDGASILFVVTRDATVLGYQTSNNQLVYVNSLGTAITEIEVRVMPQGGFFMALGTKKGQLCCCSDQNDNFDVFETEGVVTCLKMSGDSCFLVAGTRQGALYLFRIQGKQPIATPSHTTKIIGGHPVSLNFLGDQHSILVETNGLQFLVWGQDRPLEPLFKSVDGKSPVPEADKKGLLRNNLFDSLELAAFHPNQRSCIADAHLGVSMQGDSRGKITAFSSLKALFLDSGQSFPVSGAPIKSIQVSGDKSVIFAISDWGEAAFRIRTSFQAKKGSPTPPVDQKPRQLGDSTPPTLPDSNQKPGCLVGSMVRASSPALSSSRNALNKEYFCSIKQIFGVNVQSEGLGIHFLGRKTPSSASEPRAPNLGGAGDGRGKLFGFQASEAVSEWVGRAPSQNPQDLSSGGRRHENSSQLSHAQVPVNETVFPPNPETPQSHFSKADSFSGEPSKPPIPKSGLQLETPLASQFVFFSSRFAVLASSQPPFSQTLFDCHSSPISSVALFHPLSLVASAEASVPPKILVWNYESRETLTAIRLTDLGLVSRMAFSRDGRFLAVFRAHVSHSLHVFEFPTARQLAQVSFEGDSAQFLVFNIHAHTRFYTADQTTLRLWQFEGGCLNEMWTLQLPFQKGEVLTFIESVEIFMTGRSKSALLALTNSGKLFMLRGTEVLHSVKLSEASHPTCFRSLAGCGQNIFAVAFNDSHVRFYDQALRLLGGDRILTKTDSSGLNFPISSFDVVAAGAKVKVVALVRSGAVVQAVFALEPTLDANCVRLEEAVVVHAGHFGPQPPTVNTKFRDQGLKGVLVDFLPTAKLLLSVGPDCHLLVHNSESGSLEAEAQFEDLPTTIRTSPDLPFALVGFASGAVQAVSFNLESAGPKKERGLSIKMLSLPDHKVRQPVFDLALSRDSRRLAVSFLQAEDPDSPGKDPVLQICLFSAPSSFRCLRDFERSTVKVLSSLLPATLFPDKTQLPTVSASICTFSADTATLPIFVHPLDAQNGLSLLKAGRSAVWDLLSGVLQFVDQNPPSLLAMIRTQELMKFAIGSKSDSSNLRCHSLAPGIQTRTFRVSKIAESAAGRVAFGSSDGEVSVVSSGDVESRVEGCFKDFQIQCFVGHSSPITSLCFSPDGQRLFSTAMDETCVIEWDIQETVSSSRPLRWAAGLDDQFLREAPGLSIIQSSSERASTSQQKVAAALDNCDGIITGDYQLTLLAVIGRKAIDARENMFVTQNGSLLYPTGTCVVVRSIEKGNGLNQVGQPRSLASFRDASSDNERFRSKGSSQRLKLNAGSTANHLQLQEFASQTRHPQDPDHTPQAGTQEFIFSNDHDPAAAASLVSALDLASDLKTLCLASQFSEAVLLFWDVTCMSFLGKVPLEGCSRVLLVKISPNQRRVVALGATSDGLGCAYTVDPAQLSVRAFVALDLNLPVSTRGLVFCPLREDTFLTFGVVHLMIWRDCNDRLNFQNLLPRASHPEAAGHASLGGGADSPTPQFLAGRFLTGTTCVLGCTRGLLHFFEGQTPSFLISGFQDSPVTTIAKNPTRKGVFLVGGFSTDLLLFRSALEGERVVRVSLFARLSMGGCGTFSLCDKQVQSIVFLSETTCLVGTRSGIIIQMGIPDAEDRSVPGGVSPVPQKRDSDSGPLDPACLPPQKLWDFVDDDVPVSVTFSRAETQVFLLCAGGLLLAYQLDSFQAALKLDLGKKGQKLICLEDALVVVLEKEILALDISNDLSPTVRYSLDLQRPIGCTAINDFQNRLAVALEAAPSGSCLVAIYNIADCFQEALRIESGSVELLDFAANSNILLVQERSGNRQLIDLSNDSACPVNPDLMSGLAWTGDGLLLPENLRRFSSYFDSEAEICSVGVLDQQNFIVADRFGTVRSPAAHFQAEVVPVQLLVDALSAYRSPAAVRAIPQSEAASLREQVG
jgi:WD40 repeat protein